jgi:hypothetical protein
MKSIAEGAEKYLRHRAKYPKRFAKDFRNAAIFLVLGENQRQYIPLAWALTAREPGWETKTSSMNSGNARRMAETAGLITVESDDPRHGTYWRETLDFCKEFTGTRPEFSLRDGQARHPHHNSYYVLPPKLGALSLSPAEADSEPGFEGARDQVTTNRYERDSGLRDKCIAHHKTKDGGKLLCQVCGMDFSQRYGDIGKGFIHVHHVDPLGNRQERHKVDPTINLKPVCPNCHAMLHKAPGNNAFSLDQIRERLFASGYLSSV